MADGSTDHRSGPNSSHRTFGFWRLAGIVILVAVLVLSYYLSPERMAPAQSTFVLIAIAAIGLAWTGFVLKRRLN